MYSGSIPNGFTAGLPNYYLDHHMCFFYGLKIHLCKCSFLSSTRIIHFCPKPPLSSLHFSGHCEDLNKAEKSQASCCLCGRVFTSACESSPNPWWGQHSWEQLHMTDLFCPTELHCWGKGHPRACLNCCWNVVYPEMKHNHQLTTQTVSHLKRWVKEYGSRRNCRPKWSWHEGGRASGYRSLLN